MPLFSPPQLPSDPGVYLFRDNAGHIIYIGKAKNLKKRVSSYFLQKSPDQITSKIYSLIQSIRHVDYVPTKSEREALVLERRLINRAKPVFNTMWKDDKSYPYVTITTSEDFPRIVLTRNKKHRREDRYYGPYPSAFRVRNLLRWLWRRKLFPLRPCKFDIREGRPLPYEKVKSCLYLHTEECPAPCMGKISKKEYGKIVKKAMWFFGGENKKLSSQWTKEMRRFSKQKKFEDAAAVRDHIQALNHMNEHVTFREMTEAALTSRVKETRAVQDLMTNLNLPKPPERIECFDISHIQGLEKVASMVQFLHGRPNKSAYRKYIIKSVAGIDDVKSIAEAVGRRYGRLQNEGAPFPDLILIDGGKGQLQAALKSLKHYRISSIPIAALAKREEALFIPERPEPLKLPFDSPGHLLVRQVRDEAHRFALKFHRQRRSKRQLNGDEV